MVSMAGCMASAPSPEYLLKEGYFLERKDSKDWDWSIKVEAFLRVEGVRVLLMGRPNSSMILYIYYHDDDDDIITII